MAQLLVRGGTILTGNTREPAASAILVEGDRVAAVGSGEAVVGQARPDAETLELDGRVVCPGFIDAHNHFIFAILAELGIDCRPQAIGSPEELLDRLAEESARTRAGDWVRGWGYYELELGGRFPTIAELDRIAPDNPLVIGHASGHICIANTLALTAAGIGRSSPDPERGLIERDRSGRPTGVLHEHASEMVDVRARSAIIAADPQSCLEAGRSVARRYASLGLTCVCDPCVPAEAEPLYAELLADPDFPIAIVGLGIGAEGMFAPPADRLGGEPKSSNGFAVSGVKLFADGGEQCAVCISKRGAITTALRTLRNAVRYRTVTARRLLAAPVRRRVPGDSAIHTGMLFHHDHDLASMLTRAARMGLTGAVHAMGNEAIDQVLDAVEAARLDAGDEAAFRIEHVMMAAERSLPRLATLGLAAVVQPIFVRDYGFPLILTGTNRAFRTLAFRDLLDEGVWLAGSSDAPVSDPAVLPAIEAAVTRRTAQGEALDRDQGISVEEALAMYTSGSARVLGIAGAQGTLEPGHEANFVVLGEDPRSVEPDAIGRIRIDRTYRRGNITHERVGGVSPRESRFARAGVSRR